MALLKPSDNVPGHAVAQTPSDMTKWSEFRSGWPIIMGCVLGIASGVISMPLVALSIFMKGFEHDFGWSRVEVSFAHTVLVTGLLLTAPLIGFIGDRNFARGAALFSLTAIGCSFLALSRIGGQLSVFLILFGIMTLLGSGASTVSFARIISANFARARGLALGLAMSGFGLTSLILPLLLVPYVADHGWRSGFVALGIVALVAAPLVFLLLRNATPAPIAIASQQSIVIEGVTFADAIAGPAFWAMAAAFALTSLGIGGMSVHFVSMLTDVGMSPARSGAIASLIGGSTIVIRLITGWLIDRYPPNPIAAGMLVLAAFCLLAFAAFGVPFAAAGAVAYGLAYGSELDIVGFLTARMFGMRAYGRIYGVLYAAILLGSAFSPIGYGMVYQATGGYSLALQLAALALICAAAILLVLPRLATTRSGTRHG